VVCKSIAPLLARADHQIKELSGLDGDVSGAAARELEKLILKALRK
jgi:hypothetical protein